MIVHICLVVKLQFKTFVLFIKSHKGLKINKNSNKDVEMLLESDKVVIGRKFKEYRKSKRLTQFELAEKVGLNEKQISRIEAGLNYPTYLTFIKLLEVLEINISDFIEQAPLTNNPLQDEVLHLIKTANNAELKMYLDVLKALKKNFKKL